MPGRRITAKTSGASLHRMAQRATAFTLLELLIVVGILAVVATLGWTAFRPSAAERGARAYLHLVQTARLAAIAGTGGSVRWSPEASAFEVRAGPPATAPCLAPVVRRLPPPDRVAVTRHLRAGVAWQPDGSGRGCDGGGVYGGRVRFEDRRAVWDVVVASTGRLRLEVGR